MPIVAGEILVANAATTTTRRLASSAAGMLSFLARLSGRRRRHVRRSGPGAAVAGATAATAATAAAAAAGGQQPAAVMDPEQQQQQPPPAPPECYRCRCQRCSCACLGLDEEARGERADREARGPREAREDPEARPRLDRRPRPAASLASRQRPCYGPEELLRRRPPEGRPLLPPYVATLLILAYGLIGMADACSSRSTPKPRPPTPTPRPNITFHMYTCPPDYAEWYCLNGATCFTVKIVDSLLYNCLCANGYIGQRCEFKDLDGSYLPSRQRVMLETASIAGAVTIAVFLAVITFISVYIHCKRKQKELRTSGVDAVDGPAGRDLERRPFGGHSRSRLGFITKSPNSLMTVPSIEQTRMPNWNYPNQVSMRIDSVNESKHPSQ